ncbi:MAG: sigma-70 family RNA polymerase sigma factor [Methyloglobulus sp.]|nr:sigma-70 family RNA polymerase sigma factor [Methyloglobulus sp.]
MPTRKRFIDFLFLQHRRELFAFAQQRLGNEIAEDLVQETYARLLQHPDPESIDNPRAFLYQTTANLSIDMHRKQLVRERAHCEDSEIETGLARVPDPCQTPEHQLILHEELDLLNTYLLELPELTRYAFVLHRLEGLPHKEIGLRLGISARNSERRTALAAQHLLTRFEQNDPQ